MPGLTRRFTVTRVVHMAVGPLGVQQLVHYTTIRRLRKQDCPQVSDSAAAIEWKKRILRVEMSLITL